MSVYSFYVPYMLLFRRTLLDKQVARKKVHALKYRNLGVSKVMLKNPIENVSGGGSFENKP